MLPVRIKIGWKAAVVAGIGVACVIVAERSLQAAGQATPLLNPTPLVLKDGRIAKVSIHEVPFAPGEAGITGGARASLTDLARTLGTDCFLTAQVIGHIEPGEVAGDTLNAHRLARARADAVQASLIDQGLPAKAIASVWDWQFMVRQPQATLWIFELTVGEDCEGEPLPSDMVAQAPRLSEPERAAAASGNAMAPASSSAESAPAPQVAEAPPQPISPASRQQAIVPAIAAAESAAPPQGAGVEASRTRGTLERDAAETEPAPTRAAVPRVTGPLPAGPETTTVVQPTERQTVAARPTPSAPRARETASDGKVERGPDGAWVITFATNSSYFPAGVSRRLRQLVSEIDRNNRYRVSLQVAVSGTTKVAGAKSAQEAARYNKWLAERRMERVRQWLVENVNPDQLTIAPEYLADDESRRVVVRLSEIGAS